MKAILLALFGLVPLAFAQTSFEKDFDSLQRQRDAAIAKAKEPVDRKFRDEAEKLLAKAIQSGNFDTAEKIKKELVALTPANGGGYADTYWAKNDGKRFLSMIHFKSDGTLEEVWYENNGSRREYKLKYTHSKATASTQYNWGNTSFVMTDDSIKRADGYMWKRSDVSTYKSYFAATAFGDAVRVLSVASKR